MAAIIDHTYAWRPSTFVSYGLPFAELVKLHLATDDLKRAYLLISSSLAAQHPEIVETLKTALGEDVLVGERVGVKPHTPWDDVLIIARDVADKKPDILITLGGGSLTDCAKVLALTLSNPPPNGDFSIPYLATLVFPSPVAPATIPQLNIPTTLSAAEYSYIAGAVDPRTEHKEMFKHPSVTPKYVVLDPDLAATTPEWVWRSTGVRAVDHCVETLGSLVGDAKADEAARRGLGMLCRGLLGGEGREMRLEAMLGARWSMDAVCREIPLGGSHAIGHQLGTYNIAHGHTSCVLSPAVQRYNKPVNAHRQQLALDAIWEAGKVVTDVLEKRGLKRETADLCDVLDAVFRELGMPRTLKEVGFSGTLGELAEKALRDRWCATNAIPLVRKEQVEEILRMVEG